MTFPNYPGKHREDALLRPARFHAYLREIGKHPTQEVPEAVILCFQASLLEHIREHHPGARGDGYLARMLLPEDASGRVGVYGGFGIGAPVSALQLEDLVAFGVRRFVSIGTAGSLQPDLGIGDLVVCESAIRDEGTSHHYLAPGDEARASARLTTSLRSALDTRGRTHRVGATWTTDAPYRETIAEVRHYQAQGVLTVEMEAAALFAVAGCRGVELAAAFSISDTLANLTWTPRFGSPETREGLEALYGAARDALLADESSSGGRVR